MYIKFVKLKHDNSSRLYMGLQERPQEFCQSDLGTPNLFRDTGTLYTRVNKNPSA